MSLISALASSPRAPRLSLLANGASRSGVVRAEVTSTNSFGADRFRIQLALAPGDAAFWSQQDSISIDLQLGLGGSSTSLIQGLVDSISLDASAGLLDLSGRDFTAGFIDTRTQESFANRTASEVAGILAGRHNLGIVATPTATEIGRYYQNEHSRLVLAQHSRAISEWDLLVGLARQEGFDVYVQGTTLYFQPPPVAPQIITITPQTCQHLRLQHALTLAQDIDVTVQSWNTAQQIAVSETASVARAAAAPATGMAMLHYRYIRPNLTAAQAQSQAQTLLADLTRHEWIIAFTRPGGTDLTRQCRVALAGTNSDFDQLYDIAEIETSLSLQGGFIQRVRARAQPATTQG